MFSHEVVTPPAATSLVVPIATVRQHCRVSGTYDDNLLTLYCQTAANMVEAYTGRSLLGQTLRLTSTSILPPASVPLSSGPLLVYPMWYGTILSERRIDFPRSPVTSVVSVNVTQHDGTIQLLSAATDYLLDKDTDPSGITFTGFQILPTQRLNIVYSAGYPVGRVPNPLASAVLLMTGYLYSHRGDDEMNDLPAAVKSLCDPFRLYFYGGSAADGR